MDEIVKESRVLCWIKKGLHPFLGGGPVWAKEKVKGWLSFFLRDFQEQPLMTTGVVLFVVLGTNLFWILLLGGFLPPQGVFVRSLLFVCALFFMMQRADWKTFSSESRFIQWLRRR